MVCLETTFLVDILRGNEKAKSILESIDNENDIKAIATPSIMELISGAIANPKIKGEKDKVINFINSFAIFDLNKESSILAGEIEAGLSQKGETIEPEDIMIAAICIKNKETLVTRNKKHFEKIPDLKIMSY